MKARFTVDTSFVPGPELTILQTCHHSVCTVTECREHNEPYVTDTKYWLSAEGSDWPWLSELKDREVTWAQYLSHLTLTLSMTALQSNPGPTEPEGGRRAGRCCRPGSAGAAAL